MDYNIKEVAFRLKGLRTACDLSIEEFAKLTNISVEDYSKIENGEKDFSVSFLYKCAEIFDIDMIEILTGTTPTLSNYCVVRKGKGLPVARRDRFEYQMLAYLFKDKNIEPMLVVAPFIEEEHGQPVKMSQHDGQEWDYILSGKLRVVTEGCDVVLSEGDSIYYDSGKPHGMVAVDGEECRFLAVLIDK